MSFVNPAINIGMMDSAYFVGRKEITNWINSTLELEVKDITETANGAIALQLMDVLFPGKVPMQRVNWGARYAHEFIGNYKLLQEVFKRLDIDKIIPVERLIKAKYQDNLEWMQFFKAFYTHQAPNGSNKRDYDAIGRRAKGKGVRNFKPAFKDFKKTSTKATTITRKLSNTTNNNNKENVINNNKNNTEMIKKLKKDLEEAVKLSELTTNSNAEIKKQALGLERERDFYFGKLRDVEILLQSYTTNENEQQLELNNSKELVDNIFKILYATEDEMEDITSSDILSNVDSSIL